MIIRSKNSNSFSKSEFSPSLRNSKGSEDSEKMIGYNNRFPNTNKQFKSSSNFKINKKLKFNQLDKIEEESMSSFINPKKPSIIKIMYY